MHWIIPHTRRYARSSLLIPALGLALSLSLVVAITPARARLGETLEQCKARYGEPLGSSETGTKFEPLESCVTFGFKKGDVEIAAIFLRDKCVAISYQKRVAGGDGYETLDKDQLELLRAANTPPKTTWESIDQIARVLGQDYFRGLTSLGFQLTAWPTDMRSDRLAFAQVRGKAYTFVSRELIEAIRKQELEQKLKDFEGL
ncbi:hypothetical protein DB346_15475 [Verrucomicrobia bacterium LW23]|nr:hypothetical protein DB346_15475 [Verrucomicrobia bacterium LW23]